MASLISLRSILAFQRHFCARDTDIIIASFPKTGATWLKSLLFSMVNREKYGINQSPLLDHNPHELVNRIEFSVRGNVDELPSPRLLHTHLPYMSLPESIKDSGCKVICIGRNPMDTLVSFWHFSVGMMKKASGADVEYSLDNCFEDFTQGKVFFGPFFEHLVEYWNQSLERPEKIFFLKYEDLIEDPVVELKKLAEYVGLPFSLKEEREGVIKEIIELCSIKSLKEMKVNKSGALKEIFDKSSFFRKGEVGNRQQYLSPSMAEKMNKLMEEKLEGTGLPFKLCG